MPPLPIEPFTAPRVWTHRHRRAAPAPYSPILTEGPTVSSQWTPPPGPRQKESEEKVRNYLSKPTLVRLYRKEGAFLVHTPSEGICGSENQAVLYKEARSWVPLWEGGRGRRHERMPPTP